MRVKTTIIMFYQSGPPKQKIGAMCMCDDAARLNTVNAAIYWLSLGTSIQESIEVIPIGFHCA
jgi:hypothetical protein